MVEGIIYNEKFVKELIADCELQKNLVTKKMKGSSVIKPDKSIWYEEEFLLRGYDHAEAVQLHRSFISFFLTIVIMKSLSRVKPKKLLSVIPISR